MPLRIFQRPDLPYDNESKHNDQRYGLISAREKPPTADMLDADLDYIIDSMDILSQDIQDVQAGVIVGSDDPTNTNKLLTTDGANTGWTFINANNIQDGAISTAKIAANAIVNALLGDASVTPPKLANNSVTDPKIASMNGSKIIAGSLPLNKLLTPASASVIGGTTTNGGSWYELTLGNWQIATKKPQNNGVTAVSLAEVWSGTNGTFDGAKITPESIDGSIAMQSNSTPLGTMKSAGTTTSVVCGRTTDQKFVEVTLGNLQVITKTTNATSPSAQNLSTVFNNEAGTPYNGSQLQNNSTPITKLQNAGQVAPFAMGYVLGNGTIQKSLNVASVTRTGAGYYEVRFTAQANDSNYIVVFGTQDSGTPGFIVANIAQNTRTVNGFDVETGSGAALINGEFNFVVYAF